MPLLFSSNLLSPKQRQESAVCLISPPKGRRQTGLKAKNCNIRRRVADCSSLPKVPQERSVRLLVAPYRTILSLRYAITRDTLSGRFALPQNGAIALVLSFAQAHLFDTPFCNISRDSCSIPHAGNFWGSSGNFQGSQGTFQKLGGAWLSGGRGCLWEGRLGVPGQVWEFRFLPSPPSSTRANRSSRKVWENTWKSQTSSSRHLRPSETCSQRLATFVSKSLPLSVTIPRYEEYRCYGGTRAEWNCPRFFYFTRKILWKTRKTIRNVTEKCLAPLRPLKNFHRHFSTNYKSFWPPKICTKKGFFFTARLCTGGHAKSLLWRSKVRVCLLCKPYAVTSSWPLRPETEVFRSEGGLPVCEAGARCVASLEQGQQGSASAKRYVHQVSDVGFQLQPTLHDSSPHLRPPLSGSQFRVVVRSFSSRFWVDLKSRLEIDSKSTRKRPNNDSKWTPWEGGSEVGGWVVEGGL